MTAEIRGPFLERVDDDAPDNRRHVPLRSKMKENKRGIFIFYFLVCSKRPIRCSFFRQWAAANPKKGLNILTDIEK
jgi:hypothetical protein